MNTGNMMRLKRSLDENLAARENCGLPTDFNMEPGMLPRFAAIEQVSGLFMAQEYADFARLLDHGSHTKHPFFRRAPLVPVNVAVDCLVDESGEFGGLADFPYIGVCESDGAGLFVELKAEKCYDAALIKIAPGLEPRPMFPNIYSFLSGVTECLRAGMSHVVLSTGIGSERAEQETILKKYR